MNEKMTLRQRIAGWKLRWHFASMKYRRWWDGRHEIMQSLRSRWIGEPQFASRAIEFGDSYDGGYQIHEIMISEGLFGWKDTGITHTWRFTGRFDMRTEEDFYLYKTKRYETFDAALDACKRDQLDALPPMI